MKEIENLTEDMIDTYGIKSIAIIAERSMFPWLLIRYANGNKKVIKGVNEIKNWAIDIKTKYDKT